VRRVVFKFIFTDGRIITVKLTGLIKMHLNETCFRDRTGKDWSMHLLNILKLGDDLSSLLFSCTLLCATRNFR